MTLLGGKTAVVHGGGGTVGGAVAREFARQGASVFLAGRRAGRVGAAAAEIRAMGGVAEAARVDALDASAVEEHMDAVAARAGGIDVCLNAVGIPQRGLQGTPLLELDPERFVSPISACARTHFLTATSAGRRMAAQGSGVILTLTATPARAAAPVVGGMGPAWAAVEALTRGLAAELGPHGVRVLCVRSHAMPETPLIGEVTDMIAEGAGVTPQELRSAMAAGTLLGRLPGPAEVAALAAFLASDRAASMTGTVANVSSGALVD
ncbi:MAG TPA: SDR family oxidoreductase [Miltoncostaeaceae bacterium]|nr:SDR family oxidoreductase [Miltoncostaeaceae bacterium]